MSVDFTVIFALIVAAILIPLFGVTVAAWINTRRYYAGHQLAAAVKAWTRFRYQRPLLKRLTGGAGPISLVTGVIAAYCLASASGWPSVRVDLGFFLAGIAVLHPLVTARPPSYLLVIPNTPESACYARYLNRVAPTYVEAIYRQTSPASTRPHATHLRWQSHIVRVWSDEALGTYRQATRKSPFEALVDAVPTIVVDARAMLFSEAALLLTPGRIGRTYFLVGKDRKATLLHQILPPGCLAETAGVRIVTEVELQNWICGTSAPPEQHEALEIGMESLWTLGRALEQARSIGADLLQSNGDETEMNARIWHWHASLSGKEPDDRQPPPFTASLQAALDLISRHFPDASMTIEIDERGNAYAELGVPGQSEWEVQKSDPDHVLTAPQAALQAFFLAVTATLSGCAEAEQ